MAVKSRIHLNPSPLAKTFAKMLAGSRRGVKKVGEEVARGVIRRVINFTPPGSRGRKGSKAKQHGEKIVKADILKLMSGVANSRAERTDIAAIHKAARTGGRVNGEERTNKALVPKGALTAYIKKMVAKVGKLAAGWKGAAEKLRVNVPGWIARHNSPGDGKITITPDRVTVTMTNKVKYASAVSALFKRVRYAVEGQRKAMERRMKDQADNAAKKAGLKVSG